MMFTTEREAGAERDWCDVLVLSALSSDEGPCLSIICYLLEVSVAISGSLPRAWGSG
jgi:hypothetical protein